MARSRRCCQSVSQSVIVVHVSLSYHDPRQPPAGQLIGRIKRVEDEKEVITRMRVHTLIRKLIRKVIDGDYGPIEYIRTCVSSTVILPVRNRVDRKSGLTWSFRSLGDISFI